MFLCTNMPARYRLLVECSVLAGSYVPWRRSFPNGLFYISMCAVALRLGITQMPFV